MHILLTGGAGYIGSHTAVVLSEAGHEITLLDNFCNSSRQVQNQLEQILGQSIRCIEGDVRDTSLVISILEAHKIEAVMHFAGLKSVGEAAEKPLEYYSKNLQGSISLFNAMAEANVKTLIFSSSATVYGNPQYLPIDESHPLSATNAYGRSKLYIEEILADIARADEAWKIICLRYFNPVGAHHSGLIGENSGGIPNNLMPYIGKVAGGVLPHLNIYGDDYPTIDGTGIRDYIHVMDLAEGHLAALNYSIDNPGWEAFNLGTGKGSSVLELLSEYQQISGKKISFIVQKRRPGDVDSCFANVDRARDKLSWVAHRGLSEMCQSSWLWQSQF